MNYWLMKTEPEVFSIDDLKRVKSQCWDGVRNYQARNYMMKDMKLNDQVLFYHSNANPSGIVGIAKIFKTAYPDHTQFDKKSEYFDPKSSIDRPRWFMVDVSFIKKFNRIITLDELKTYNELKEMIVIKKGNRLSITPISKNEFEFISSL